MLSSSAKVDIVICYWLIKYFHKVHLKTSILLFEEEKNRRC